MTEHVILLFHRLVDHCVYPLRMDDSWLRSDISGMNEHRAADDGVMEML